MSLKPPPSGGVGPNGLPAKPVSSFLKVSEGSMRSGVNQTGGGGGGGKSTFSKMVSGRANQSMRGGQKGSGGGSGRRSRKKKKDDTARVIVDGKDVTPLPLMSAAHATGMQAFQQSTTHGTGTLGGASTADMSQLDSSTEHSMMMGGGGMMNLGHGGMSSISGDSEHVGFRDWGHDADRDWAGGMAARSGMQFEYATDPTTAAPAKVKVFTDAELREKITIKIEETETITLFHLPGIKIWSEDETEALKSEKMNKNYQACLEKHKEKDKYTMRGVQTFNPTSRDKEVQVAPPTVKSVGCDVTQWDIYDVATKLESQVTAAGANGNVPRIQHESDLLARTAETSSASGAPTASRAEDEEEELAAARTTGGGEGAQGGRQGGATNASNTPSVHSAQQSFLGGAGQQSASFRGGKPSERSWHANLSTHASGTQTASQSQGGNLSSHVGGASASTKAGGGGGAGGSVAGGPTQSKPSNPFDKLLNKPTIIRRLKALEQAVVQNELHEAQMLYRNHPECSEELFQQLLSERSAGPKYELRKDENAAQEGSSLLPPLGSNNLNQQEKSSDHAPTATAVASTGQSPAGVAASLIPLWSFNCPLTKGLNVSCMSWNKQNFDLLAAGYGSLEFGHNSRDAFGNSINGILVPTLPKDGSSDRSPAGGLILFWSLKNPSFPQKIFHTKSSVTSLDFSDEHPHLLAAGMYDGSVAIYDIRDTHSKPALESVHSSGKHSEPVWGVKFVAKELHKRSQQLTSISTDGSVKQWSMKKGLVPHELMQLKRIPNRAQLQGTTMEGLSREASGMCFDFPINDGTQYFAGTEDGLIHKCSVSYNEQTLENFYGHTGPVYKVRCSPFLPDAFLSCSADWSAMLWSQKVASKPVLKFAAGGHDYVMDISWSPNQACVFGLVSREGRIEIWDLDVSPLDPVIKYYLTVDTPIAEATDSTNTTGAASLLSATSAPSTSLTSSTTTAAVPSPTPKTTKRYLSCMAFSATAPVVLVGTSDGSIELFRLEGTALTSVNPNGTGANALTGQCFGQELNAATVMQVPRDRERDLITNGETTKTATHEDQARIALEQHQSNLLKFREQAKKLEAIMEQHNDTKNKLSATASNSNEGSSGNGTKQ